MGDRRRDWFSSWSTSAAKTQARTAAMAYLTVGVVVAVLGIVIGQPWVAALGAAWLLFGVAFFVISVRRPRPGPHGPS